MKERDTIATMTLRSLLDALDNASAIPMTAKHVPVYGRSGDVPRKHVTEGDYQVILRNEASSRHTAALEFERLGCIEAAARVRAELSIVMHYLE
jgi:uncharacterized protein YqeY